MPELRRWVQFLGSAGLMVGTGVVFVKYFVPDDTEFLKELSPELKAQYLKEKALREKAMIIMQKRIQQTQDRPAWLEGSAKMRRLDREVSEEARREVEKDQQEQAIEEERARLQLLAEKEKRR